MSRCNQQSLAVFLAILVAADATRSSFIPGSNCGINKAIKTVKAAEGTTPENLEDCTVLESESPYKIFEPPEPVKSYKFVLREWSECSSTCQGGVTTRTTVCIDEDTQEVQDASMCLPDLPATEEKACNEDVCCVAIPSDYTAKNGEHYKYHPNGLSHAEAVAACATEGARLATCKDSTEFMDVFTTKNMIASDHWTGLFNTGGHLCQDDACVGKLEWSDGTPLEESSMYLFTTGMTMDGPFKCVKEANNFASMLDEDCSNTYPFVCKIFCGPN